MKERTPEEIALAREVTHLYDELENPGEITYAHSVFIEEMCIHGNRKWAYKAAYPKASDATARVNAGKLLQKSYIAECIYHRRLRQHMDKINMLKEFYDKKLADIEEKRNFLASVMRGQVVVEKEVVRNGQVITLKQKPEVKERITALKLDNELEEAWLDALRLPDKTTVPI